MSDYPSTITSQKSQMPKRLVIVAGNIGLAKHAHRTHQAQLGWRTVQSRLIILFA
jgi:hypothetical protein